MKKKMRRFLSVVLALILCLSFTPLAFAAEETEIVHNVTLTDNGDNATYTVSYETRLTMGESMARAAAMNIAAEDMETMRFICTLSDGLVSQFTGYSASDFSFVKADGTTPVDLYVLDRIVEDNGKLYLVYGLNMPQVTMWLGDPDLGTTEKFRERFLEPVIMKANKSDVSKAAVDNAFSSNVFESTAKIDVVNTGSRNLGLFENYYGTEFNNVLAGITKIYEDSPAAQGKARIVRTNQDVGATRYKITIVGDDSKGSVSVDSSTAYSGQEVTITSNPKDGYRLVSLTPTGKNGEVISVTRNSDGSFSFIMPDCDVELKYVFDLGVADPEKTGVASMLIVDDHIPFMIGDTSGMFRPDAQITRAEVAMIFFRLLRNKDVETSVGFNDVDEDAWYAQAVNTLASLEILNGVGGNLFEPNRPITRAEFATIAARFASSDQKGFDFNDVPDDHWAHEYIAAAAYFGWVQGVGDNRFEADRGILRAEAATIVNRMLGRLGDKEKIDNKEGAQFPDVSKDHWGWYAIGEAATDHDYDFNITRTDEVWSKVNKMETAN